MNLQLQILRCCARIQDASALPSGAQPDLPGSKSRADQGAYQKPPRLFSSMRLDMPAQTPKRAENLHVTLVVRAQLETIFT